MATFEIPVRADLPAYDMQVTLEAKIYSLNFRYNERMALWIMDILSEEGVELLMGTPLIVGIPLTGRFASEELPPGDFLLLDEEGKETKADRNNFGENLKLMYAEEADLQ